MTETPQQTLERLLVESLKQGLEIKNAILNINDRLNSVEYDLKVIIQNQINSEKNVEIRLSKKD